MFFTDDEQALFDKGIVLSANQLIPSKVYVDDEDDYLFSADLYATTDSLYQSIGYLHFRLFESTSVDLDPALSYGDRKILEITLAFEQRIENDNDSRFIFDTENGATIVFSNGETQEIKTPSQLSGLSLIFASKIFFIDVVRLLMNSENENYSLNA